MAVLVKAFAAVSYITCHLVEGKDLALSTQGSKNSECNLP
jgi:hypothetical protein